VQAETRAALTARIASRNFMIAKSSEFL